MNRKSSKQNVKIKLKRCKPDRRVLLTTEKIIRKHLVPADFYIEIGKPRYLGIVSLQKKQLSSARFLPKTKKKYRYIKVRSKLPNIEVQFSPLKTEIRVQTVYSTGEKLKKTNEIINDLVGLINSLARN